MPDYTISVGEYNNIQLDTQHSLIGSSQIYNATSWQQIFYAQISVGWVPLSARFCQLPDIYSSIIAIAFRPSTLDYSVALPILKLRIDAGDVFYNGPCVIRSSEDAADAIQCNIFTKERIETYPVPRYGMMVYDENGKAIFNSDCNILKIQEICQFQASYNSLPITISHNTQNPFYVVPFVQSTFSMVWPTSYLPACSATNRVMGIKKISATQFSVNWIPYNIETAMGYGWEEIPDSLKYVSSIPNPVRIGLCTL